MEAELIDYLMQINFEHEIKRIFKYYGYKYFKEGDYNLNIFGVRDSDLEPNVFNDVIGVSYNERCVHKLNLYRATTDCGLDYMINPVNVGGAAFVQEGQYEGLWKIGYHYNILAFVQKANIACYRDNNRNEIIDLDPKSVTIGNFYGINLHPCWTVETADKVGKWSAGCQVTKNRKDFGELLDLGLKQSKIINSFTYTLFSRKQIEEAI